MAVALEVDEGGLAEVRLERPERGNAFDLELTREFNARLLECEQRDDVRAVLICGSGRTFCVGGDLGYMRAAGREAGTALRVLADEMHRAVRCLARMPKPVIAAAHGAVAGVGLSLVCAADLALASEDASFLLAYTAVGLSPDGGCSWLLPRIVGPRAAAEMTLANRRVAAAEAAQLGLLSRVVSADSLREESRALGAKLGAAPPRATAMAALLLRRSAASSLDEQLELEAESISQLAAGAEAREAIEAFFARSG